MGNGSISLGKWLSWLLGLGLALLGLTACDLPQVSAEERLFLPLTLEFLDQYQLPRQSFEGTPVGGLSGLAYDRPHDRFYAISDDHSKLAPARFYTLQLRLNKTDPAKPTIEKIDVTGVTILKNQAGQPFAQGTIDPEGIALSPLGSVFISSEGNASDGIPPFLAEFDLQTGQWRRQLPLAPTYLPDTAADPPKQKGIQDNLGFEALTLVSPGATASEPFRVFAATESSLLQDQEPETAERGARTRLVHYLAEAGRSLPISEHAYVLDPPPAATMYHGLTDLQAIDQGGHFLSLERSLGLRGFQAKIFQVMTGDATDTSTLPSLKGELKGIQPVRKQLLLNLSDLKIRLDNLEGMAIGPRLPDGSQSLLVVSDDNFRIGEITQVLLFRLKQG